MWEMLFANFLSRYQKSIDPSLVIDAFLWAMITRDALTAEELLSEYPGLSDLLKSIEAGKMPTPDQFDNSPDGEFCRVMEPIAAVVATPGGTRREIELLQYILRWSNLRAGVVADIGCGTGHHMTFLKKYGCLKGKCHGFDASMAALRAARNIAKGEGADVNFSQCLCGHLPLSDGSVGQAWMFSILPWVIKWQEALDEANRVLTPNGRIILVINGSHERCRVTPHGARNHLEALGFRIDDESDNRAGRLIAAGKR